MASTSVILSREDAAAGPSTTYSYYSQPRALPARRKYRTSLDPNEPQSQLTGEPDPLELQRRREAHRKALARKRAKEQLRTRTPDPVEGRRHVNVQTELYLEELADRIIEVDVECQTDAFLDRPATPLFIPAKTGKDVATQIWEGELFDFDIEVRPMLEVLVGKTIEQALLEVMEEEELADMRAHQYAYLELRCAELAEERRKKQQLEVLQKEKETSEKIAARAFAQRYLSDLIPSVFGSLRDSGYFYDPVERDIETGFIPWLMEQVEENTEKKVLGRIVADIIQPPEQVLEPQPSAEVVIAESSAEPEPSDQLGLPSQPEPSDQMEVPGHLEPSGQTEAYGHLEVPDPAQVPVESDVAEQLEVPDQGKAGEEEPEIKDPEPQ
ncbi:hypothetical protein JD844_034346 [Phrynosoma platyrhinos]|uniref:Radial spoke head 3 n=1 Tax=Phrynosoma platyrhinos TaxID=52577 RepID=A0ABQ7T8U7_PHRPL|nr:hypothetical protein JD844_034346 [Phrynosoma platyrhinos]